MPRLAFPFALLLTIIMGLLVVQQHLGIGLTGRAPLDVAQMRPDDLAWRVSLPRQLRDDPVVVARAVVLEDGRPIGVRAPSNRAVRELGGGRYHIRGNSLRLAAADQSDPRTNDRSYELKHPVRVRDRVMIGVWALMTLSWGWFLWARRRATTGPPAAKAAEDTPDTPDTPDTSDDQDATDSPTQAAAPARRRFHGWPSLAAAAACALLATVLWAVDRPFSDGAFSAHGLPYSDAFGWNLMAEQIADGVEVTAFPGQRRLFPWMLAAIYAWTGSWLPVAAAVQLVFIVGCAVFVYALITPLARSRWIGAGAALAMIASPLTRHMAQLVMTEPCGLLFSLAGLLLLWQGLAQRRLWVVAAAGVAYGLGNLASPFTFAAAPLYALVALAHDWHAWRGHGWWRRLRATVVLTLTVTLVYLPWLTFQKHTTDSFTFSTNSPGLLYGALTEDGGWGPAMFAEASAAGYEDYSTERNSFFMRRYIETVKEDPLAYIRLLGNNSLAFVASIERTDPAQPGVAIMALLALAATLAWRGRSLWPLLLWPGLAWLMAWSHYSLSTLTLVIASWLLLLALGRGRDWLPLALIGATAAAVVLITAMTGNLMPRRGWLFFDWLQIGLMMAAHARLLLAGSSLLTRLTGRRHQPAPALPVPSTDGTPRLTPAAAAALVFISVWLIAGAAVLGYRQLAGPRTVAYSWDDSLTESVLAQHDAPPGTSVRLVILTDHQCRLRPGEDISHYSRAFAPQPVVTTLVRPRILNPDQTAGRAPLVRFAGDLEELSRTEPFALLTVSSFDDSRYLGETWLLEAVALVPLVPDEDGRLRPDHERAHQFEPLEPAAEAGGEQREDST